MKRVRTVNKAEPRTKFLLYHSNEKGYCPVSNREIIGIVNARNIVKKVLNLKAKEVDLIINKLQDERGVLIFGKGVKPHFEDRITKTPNVFFLGGINE